MVGHKKKRRSFKPNTAQLELNLERPIEPDRNYHLGGKSFYFFDFDDNVAYLATPIIIFHKDTGNELHLSSGEFAQHGHDIGKQGQYANYYVDINDETGSFRNFRDRDIPAKSKGMLKQAFIEDIETAIQKKDFTWKAPSWNCFYHATYNFRPLSVITARGHNSETIKEGISLLVKDGHLPHDPNFLSVYPVSNPKTRAALGDEMLSASVPELKKGAIRMSVEQALNRYGHNPYHRFGMSDDDPRNVELITSEMQSLKSRYPEMSFFVIQTFKDSYEKREILETKTRDIITRNESKLSQLSLL
jgi:hypothetical protein